MPQHRNSSSTASKPAAASTATKPVSFFDYQQPSLGAPPSARKVPEKPRDDVLAKSFDSMNHDELFKCLAYYKYHTQEMHRKTSELYKQHGRGWRGHDLGMKVFHIKDQVAAKIREIVQDYANRHKRVPGTRITKESRHAFNLGKARHIHEGTIVIAEDIAHITGEINSLHADTPHRFSNVIPYTTHNRVETGGNHTYYITVIQKWCFRALRQIMQVAEHEIEAKGYKTEHEADFLRDSQTAEAHNQKVYKIRLQIRKMRRSSDGAKKHQRETFPDDSAMRHMMLKK